MTARAAAPLAAGLLALATLVAFAGVRHLGFVNYDDPGYVTANPRVQEGLTAAGVRWALTTGTMANWHPATWWSHMLDVELFGLDPRGHHLTSLALHAANVVLLVALLRALTGSLWRSAAVAALFGLHPLRVESVAWVAERKDVLSGTFALLTIAAWAGWVRRPSRARYALVVVLFALGLMAKPMLVTLPVVLLLLDVWPLRRWAPASRAEATSARGAGLWTLVREKLPLFALAALSGVVTIAVQHAAGAVRATAEVPLAARAGNALLAYVRYLGKTVHPVDLACFYPLRLPLDPARVAAAGLAVLAITAAALAFGRRRPWLAVGWLWFVVMLLPVIGLLQAGPQALADRYTYLPHVGLFIAVVWGAAEAVPRFPARSAVLATGVIGALVGCVALTRAQVRHWHDSRTLFAHALAVTEDNHIARVNLGLALAGEGREAEAIPQYREAVRLVPHYAAAHALLGAALADAGARTEAERHLGEASRLDPGNAEAARRLGSMLLADGRAAEAVAPLERARAAAPERAEIHNALGAALAALGRDAEAAACYREAIRLAPADAGPRVNLAGALRRAGRLDEAEVELRAALAADAAHPEALYMLGNVLAQGGRLDEAAARYAAALAVRPGYAEAANNLGLVRAAAGDLDAAIAGYSEAIRADPRFAPAYYNRAVALRRRGDQAGAAADLAEAKRLDPRTPD